jgi:flavin-dependent dehydrogenase
VAPDTATVDAVVIGGGPAGSAIARLLALWGHSVVVLTRDGDATRGAAESLPPSTRKLLATIGALESVDGAGFLPTTGNTVWWGMRDGHAEQFDAPGYQVFRPVFDRVLLAGAAAAGAEVVCGAHVQRVHLDGDVGARIEYQQHGHPSATVPCRFAVDASGRAGVVARQGFRRHEPGYLTQAFIGEWRRETGWDLPDETHTLVETYEDGWAWSVPLSRTIRQVGVAVDGTTTRISRGPTLQGTYLAEIGKTQQLYALTAGAALGRVWACDASLYSSHRYAGPRFLLVGDAASCIDPLSSFGVKKALASAWVGAVAVHTCLTHPDREAIALDFFGNREQQVYGTSLQRSCEFAREAYARHPHPFWAERAETHVDPVSGDIDEDALLRAPDVQAAFGRLKTSPAIALSVSDTSRVRKRALITDREIVLGDAVSLPEAPDGIRFLAGVDLLKLRELACRHHQVPDLFDAYCRTCGPVPLPNLLGSLSVLVAKGVLS